MTIAAGETPLLNVFKDGTVLVLMSDASGKTLKIRKDGKVEGKGGEGQQAQFKIHVREKGVVSLQNVDNSGHWLRIKDNELEGIGGGGIFTHFKVEEHDHRVVLESVKHPGQHVGIVDDGDVKKPSNTGTGRHARFLPKVIHERKETLTAGTSHFEMLLAHGNVVVLESVASCKSLRVYDDGRIDGTGGNGALAQFIVHVRGEHQIALQCVKNPERWLRIQDDELSSNGKGGPFTDLKVDSNNGHLVLESVKFPGQHVGVRDSGEAKEPNKTGTGKHAQFTVKVIKEQPEYYYAGTSLVERTLEHGNIVVLYSRASGKTLRIYDDERIDGTGAEGGLAQFLVHVRKPGVVAFQHVKHPDRWLKVKSSELGVGAGAHFCEFKVKDKGDYLVFESVVSPDEHVGVRPNGNVKPPNETREGEHAQFTPHVKKDSIFSRT